MKVRIGVADTNRVVEFEVDDPDAFEATADRAFAGGDKLLWIEDAKQRRIGIPVARVAYIEIETQAALPSVGFAPT